MGGIRRFLKHAAEGRVAAPILAVVLVALMAVEFLRPRQQEASSVVADAQPSEFRPASPQQKPKINVTLPLERERARPLRLPLGGNAQLITARDGRRDSALLAARINGRQVSLSLLRRGSAKVPSQVTFSSAPRPAFVQVVEGGAGKGYMAYAVALRGKFCLVDIHDLDSGGQGLGVARSLPLARPAGSTREVRVANWSGPTPDLFVIDRGSKRRKMMVRVLSGESRFRRLLASATVSQGYGFPSGSWSMDIGRVAGGKPDIMLVTRSRSTPSRTTEVHVLFGASKYRRFLMQVTSTQKTTTARKRQNVLGRRGGSPTWISASPQSRQVSDFLLRKLR